VPGTNGVDLVTQNVVFAPEEFTAGGGHAVTLSGTVARSRVTTGNAADPRADIDLLVFRCSTSTSCTQVGSSGGATATEQVTLNNPEAGLHRIRVVGFSVPAGSTAYDLVDTWISPALGSVSSNDANALSPAGSSWTATAVIVKQGDRRRIVDATRELHTEQGIAATSWDQIAARARRRRHRPRRRRPPRRVTPRPRRHPGDDRPRHLAGDARRRPRHRRDRRGRGRHARGAARRRFAMMSR
jgi:hypothetical protein